MTTDIFEDFDEESQDLLRELDMQGFEAFQNSGQVGNLKNNSFEEIAYEKIYGENNSCGEYKDEWTTKIIDINELLKFIRTNRPYKKAFYFPAFLIPTLNPLSSKSPSAMMLKSFYASVSSDKTIFNYEDENRKIKRQGKLEIKLNSRACHVNLDKPGYLFKIDAAKKNLNFRIAFVYEDAMHLRNYDVTPEVENDFVLGDQFNAIIIKTDDANAFVALAEHTGSKEFVKEKIKNAFVEALKIAKTGSELKFLYENIPDFILNQLVFLLKEERLWDHVNLLTDYDDTGTFSNFKDSSGALMNLFKAFGNSFYIIEKFSEDQAFLKRIYENLDGSSEFMGQVTSNRIIFASLISACCVYDNRLKTINKTFYYGKGYKIDSDISWFSDEKEDEFYLKQQKIVEHTYQQPNTETDEFGVTISLGPDLEKSYSETVDQDKGRMYHPLDMVSLVDYSSGIDIAIPVPIVFVKALAGEKERQDVELAIRIGFDIVAIIAGVIVMATTANPGVFALALADVVLATSDVAINASRNEILETPGGAEFLETWEQIYVVGGIITAGPALIQSFFKAGAGLLRTANAIKNFKVANFARACITKVIFEINIANFTQNTVKEILYAEEALSNTGIKFNTRAVARFQEKGVLFIKGIGHDGKTLALAALYKGEVIAQGTAKEIRNSLKELWSAEGKVLENGLNILEQTVKYENGRIGYVDGLFDGINVNHKPAGFNDIEDVESIHPIYGKGIITKFQNFTGYFYRNYDQAKKIFTFNHGFIEDLPKWVTDVRVALVKGKGIPTQAYFTLRQMKLLGITKGEIKLVKMAQIQNLETMGYIHKAMKEKGLTRLEDVDILAAPSNEYMKTVMTQAGYETISGKIIKTDVTTKLSIRRLKSEGFPITKEFMKKYDLSDNSELFIDFNIEVNVKYIKR